MPDPATIAAGLSDTIKSLGWWRARQLEKRPIAVSMEVKSDDGAELTVVIHADNDSRLPLEVADCFLRRLQATGGCGEPDKIREDALSPVPRASFQPGILRTVPAIADGRGRS